MAVAGAVAGLAAACSGGATSVEQAPVPSTMILQPDHQPVETRIVPQRELDTLGRWIVSSSQHAKFNEQAAGSVAGSETPAGGVASLAREDRHIQGNKGIPVLPIDHGYTWDALHATLSDGACANVRLPGARTVYVRTAPEESSVIYKYRGDPSNTLGTVTICNPAEEGQPGSAAETGIVALPVDISLVG